MATVHTSSLTYLDFSNEQASVKINNGPITALTIAGFLSAFGDFQGATDAIVKGTRIRDEWVGDRTTLAAAAPSDEFAQRELKWLVTYEGSTSHKKFTLTIPTADPTGRLVAGTDLADLTNTDIAAWVTKFEAIAKSPDSDTEGVNVLSIRLVGRNI
jgi:hypothetical protein